MKQKDKYLKQKKYYRKNKRRINAKSAARQNYLCKLGRAAAKAGKTLESFSEDISRVSPKESLPAV